MRLPISIFLEFRHSVRMNIVLSEPDINVYFVFCDKETDCFQIRNKKTLHFAILWLTLFFKRKIHNKLLEWKKESDSKTVSNPVESRSFVWYNNKKIKRGIL